MKNLFIIITLSLLSIAANAQDTIRKTDGSILVGKVIEISEDYILYTNLDQPEGPNRKLSITSVSKITYQNGTNEIFTHSSTQNSASKPQEKEAPIGTPGTVNNTGKTIIVPRRGPDTKVRPGEIFPDGKNETGLQLKSGLYLDMLFGYASTNKISYGGYNYSMGNYYTGYNVTRQNATFGVRLGTKFYFGSNEKFKLGLNVTWVGLTGLIDEYDEPDVIFSPTNIGLASIFKFNEHVGLEVNTSTGIAASSILSGDLGIKYGLDVKFRYDKLAIGVDVSKMSKVFNSTQEGANLIALTIGLKF